MREKILWGRLLRRAAALFLATLAVWVLPLCTGAGAANALRELGAVYSAAGNFTEAERYFREAIALGASDAQTNYNMASVLLELGENSRALDYAKKAAEDGKSPVFLYTYGLAAERNGMKDVALTQYAAAIAADPKYVKPRINLGNIYLDAGRTDEALTQFTAAYGIEKDNLEVNNNLGKVYGLKGQYSQSVEHYARAVQLSPADAGIRMNLASAYVSAGLPEKARDCYLEVLQENAEYWDASFELGKIYVTLGDRAAAKSALQNLLDKNPGYPAADEVRALLMTL